MSGCHLKSWLSNGSIAKGDGLNVLPEATHKQGQQKWDPTQVWGDA